MVKKMINLDFYKGKDLYSDGIIEDEILKIVEEKKDFTSVILNDNRWPVLYHLSPERRNLLEWYPFKKEADLLEIGAGCGAITGLLCEKVKKVTAVELSKRRAEVIYNRYKELKNLEIIVGNFEDIRFDLKFDYITLIGVLEYAATFIKSSNPYKTFLSKVGTLLENSGKLIIAIENKFGLKYFAGAGEDHTGRMFDGVEGYLNYSPAETFGKEELLTLLGEAGFDISDFYYPYPDYKFADEIYSDSYLPGVNTVFPDAPNYDVDRFKLFSERRVFSNIIKNKKFDFFSNSFLIIAVKKD